MILWDTVVHDTGTRGGTSAGNKARLQRTLPRQPQAQQSHVDADNQMQARCSPGSEAVSTVLEREIVAHALAQKKSRRGGGQSNQNARSASTSVAIEKRHCTTSQTAEGRELRPHVYSLYW